jgi:hypothetical protein
METAQELRRLIEQYRARLERGASAALVAFILEKIAEAETKLAAIESDGSFFLNASRRMR